MKSKIIKCICGIFLVSAMSVTVNAGTISGVPLEDLVERYNYAISVLGNFEESKLSNLNLEDIKESVNDNKILSPNGNAKMEFSIDDDNVKEVIIYKESDSPEDKNKLFVIEVAATYFAFDSSYQEKASHLSQALEVCENLCNMGTIEYNDISMSAESTGEYDIFEFKYTIEQEPIIGEWKFQYMYNDGKTITSEQLAHLGYKDDGGIYFSCKEDEYFLGMSTNEVMTDSWRIDTNDIFKENYAYSYLLDEKGEIRAVIESEEDLDTLYIFIGTDFLLYFQRKE